jgi:hypothetical protein
MTGPSEAPHEHRQLVEWAERIWIETGHPSAAYLHRALAAQSATAANELLFRCHLAFNLGRAIDRSRLCRDIADYVVPLYKDRCG